MSTDEPSGVRGYMVPTYRAPDDAPWYHFLHGNVPGHQIDFMYRPDVPQPPLTRQHFSHLSRLMKYIEPQEGNPYAFAIGNLSRDDTQHEPGHGGLALIFGLRIRGATDHAGRQDPPFAHGAAAIDRELDRRAIWEAVIGFHERVLGAAESAEWYQSYVRAALEAPDEVVRVLEGYLAGFADLAGPTPSALSKKWTMGEATPPPRVVIAHADDAPFGMIATCAAKIAAVLYPSDIRWTAISTGRERDLENGVTVRFVAERNLTAADQSLGVRRIDEVPNDDEEIARELFGARSTVVAKSVARGWRDRYAAPQPEGDAPSVDQGRPSWEGAPAPVRAPSSGRGATSSTASTRPPSMPSARPPPMATPAPSAKEPAEGIEVDLGDGGSAEALPPAVVPPKAAPFVAPAPTRSLEKAAPVPDFRKSTSSPLKWLVVVALLAGLGAALYFRFQQESSAGAEGTADAGAPLDTGTPAVSSIPAPQIAAPSAVAPLPPPSSVVSAAPTTTAPVGKRGKLPQKTPDIFGGKLEPLNPKK